EPTFSHRASDAGVRPDVTTRISGNMMPDCSALRFEEAGLLGEATSARQQAGDILRTVRASHGDGPVGVIVRVTAQPGRRDELLVHLQAFAENARSLTPPPVYTVNDDVLDTDTFLIYEIYENVDVMERQLLSGTFDR